MINGQDVQDFIGHWLRCPVNGYLGSPYGQDLKSLLQQPLSTPAADELLDKLHQDITVLNTLPSGSTNIYSLGDGLDKMDIVLDVKGRLIPIVDTK